MRCHTLSKCLGLIVDTDQYFRRYIRDTCENVFETNNFTKLFSPGVKAQDLEDKLTHPLS